MVLGKKRVTLSVLVIAVFLIMTLAACSTTPKEPAATPAQPAQVTDYTPSEKPVQAVAVGPTKPQVAVELGDVFFAFDKFDLTAESRAILAKNAEVLLADSDIMITIEGHCDERGTEEYNLGLGERRASSARNYLVSLGVSASRIKTISYGEERPFKWGSNEAAWSQNRRAHFVVR